MKKWIAAILAMGILAGCSKPEEISHEPVTITNTVELKATEADMSPYKWIEGDTADFRETTFAEVNRLFAEGGSGIVYYGYIDCPYCQRAVPLLNEVARDAGVTVYYVDVYGPQQPTREEYNTLISYICDTLGQDENGEYEFFVPYVAGIKNGKVTGFQVSLVESFTLEDKDTQMTDEQKNELRKIFRKIIEETAD